MVMPFGICLLSPPSSGPHGPGGLPCPIDNRLHQSCNVAAAHSSLCHSHTHGAREGGIAHSQNAMGTVVGSPSVSRDVPEHSRATHCCLDSGMSCNGQPPNCQSQSVEGRCHGFCFNSGTPLAPEFALQSHQPKQATHVPCHLPVGKNRGAHTPPSSFVSFGVAAARSCPSTSHSLCKANTVFHVSAPSNNHHLARIVGPQPGAPIDPLTVYYDIHIHDATYWCHLHQW